jgi:hypothetical protein
MNGLADMLSGAKKMVQLKAQQVMQAVGVSAETKDLEYDAVRDEFLRLNEQLKKVCTLTSQLVKDMRSQANSQKELLGFMADVFEHAAAGDPAMSALRIVSTGSKSALLETGDKLEHDVCVSIQKNLENLNPKVKLRMDERKKLQLALDHYKEKMHGMSREDQNRALRNDAKSAEALHQFQTVNEEMVAWLKSINAGRVQLLLTSQAALVHTIMQSGAASGDIASQLTNDLKLFREISANHAAKVAELDSACGRPTGNLYSTSTPAAPNSIHAQPLQPPQKQQQVQDQTQRQQPQQQPSAVRAPSMPELNIFGQPVASPSSVSASMDDMFGSSSSQSHQRSQSAGNGDLSDLLGLGSAPASASVSAPSLSSSNDLLGLLSGTSPKLAPQVPPRRKSIDKKPQINSLSSNDDFMNSFEPTSRRKSLDKKGQQMGIDLLGFDAPAAPHGGNSGSMDDLLSSFSSTPKSPSSQSPMSPGGVNSAFLVMNDDDRQKHVATEAIHSEFKAKVRVSADSRSNSGVRAEIQHQFQQHVQQQAQEAAAKVRAMQAEEEALKEQKREVAGSMVQRVESWAGKKGMRKNVQAMINNFQQVSVVLHVLPFGYLTLFAGAVAWSELGTSQSIRFNDPCSSEEASPQSDHVSFGGKFCFVWDFFLTSMQGCTPGQGVLRECGSSGTRTTNFHCVDRGDAKSQVIFGVHAAHRVSLSRYRWE